MFAKQKDGWGSPIRHKALLLSYVGEGVELAAFLSFGERLESKRRSDQLRAYRPSLHQLL